MVLRLGMCLMLLSASAFAQERDSILLDAVMVYGLSEESHLIGTTVTTIDSSFQKQYASSSLGEMLSFQVPVYFRNYGSGMISSISMRGTSPQHTAVIWNGLPINSFSLGQADFSILPTAAFSKIRVHEGGGSARFGSGAIGGSVLLETNASSTPLSITQEAGSFGRYFSSLKGDWSRGKFSFSTTAYRLASQNNFPILGADRRQNHAAYHQEGIVQDIQYTLSPHQQLTLHYWYQQADREVQPTVGQFNSNDEQQDFNHRLIIKYNRSFSFGTINLSSGYVDDVINFNGNPGRVTRWVAAINHDFTFQNGWNINGGANFNHITGRISNYKNGIAEENRGDIYLAIQHRFISGLEIAINARQPFVEGFNSPFLPYVGLEYPIISKASTLAVSVNVSKNFRVPTLNDRYWQTDGAEDLIPETSYAGEAGLKWSHDQDQIKVTGFTQYVANWIQWIPGQDGRYRPRNVKEVRTRGIECSYENQVLLSRKSSIQWRLAYQLTEAITLKAPPAEDYSIGKQLIYTPRHTGSAYVSGNYQHWRSTVSFQYSGTRYTEFSNSDTYALDPFVLTDVSISRGMKIGRHQLNVLLSIKNVFNVEYFLYAGRSQPGRGFNIQLLYQLNRLNPS